MDEQKAREVAREATKQVLSVATAAVIVACAIKLVPSQRGLIFKAIKVVGLYGLGVKTYNTMYDALTEKA